jgi:hypothetical protein
MEAVFPPDFETGIVGHRHPGPEAWYVLTGTQCLETPNGLIMASAGGSAMVPEGWPMRISAVGPETRRAIVLVLHPSVEPYSMSVDDPRRPGAPHSHWKPQGLCPKMKMTRTFRWRSVVTKQTSGWNSEHGVRTTAHVRPGGT